MNTVTPPPDLVDYSLDQLSTFHRIGSYILGVFSLCGLPHTFMGLFFLASPRTFGNSQNGPPPAFFGGMMFLIGLGVVGSFMGLAIANHAASAWVRERRRYTGIQVVSAFTCLYMPLGTVLGVYSLVILSKPEVRVRFTS
ncbi:hypothetical protein EON81_04375 [bacterium]|nr:MAG: hypothetical protein EON81_04375 [bacterium]